MTVVVARLMQEDGIEVTATADIYHGYTSRAVKILKALGDELKLTFEETTWREMISESRSMIEIQQSPKAPLIRGA